MKIKSKLALLALSVFLASIFSLSAFAKSYMTISMDVREMYAKAGDTVEFQAMATNMDTETEVDVSFRLKARSDEEANVLPLNVDWVTLMPAEIVALEVTSEIPVTVAIQIPEGTEPGAYKLEMITFGTESVGDDEAEESAVGASMAPGISIKMIVTVLSDEEEIPVVEEVVEEVAGDAAEADAPEEESEKSMSYEFYFDVVLLVLMILLFAKVHALEEALQGKGSKKKK
jgi:hypothetical protein